MGEWVGREWVVKVGGMRRSRGGGAIKLNHRESEFPYDSDSQLTPVTFSPLTYTWREHTKESGQEKHPRQPKFGLNERLRTLQVDEYFPPGDNSNLKHKRPVL